MQQRITIGHSVCPHDCPSTCALEVELLEANRIGRVRGAKEHDYTAGVICAKVALRRKLFLWSGFLAAKTLVYLSIMQRAASAYCQAHRV